MTPRKITYLLLGWTMLSCNYTPKPKGIDGTDCDGLVRRVYTDSADGLKTEQLFIKSGENLVANGYQKKFDSSGRLVSLYFFKNGNRDSVGQTFFENGNTKNKWFFNHGIAYGPIYTYYNNGVLAEFREAMMPDLQFFTINYDSSGRVTSTNGAALSATLFDKKISYGLSDTAGIGFQLAISENSKFIFTIEPVTKNNRKKEPIKINDLTKLTFYPDLNMYAYVESYACKEGSVSFIATLTLLDSHTNKSIYKQSVRKNIEVR